MSLADQQFTTGKAGVSAYAPGDLVFAGGAERLHMLSFDISGTDVVGLSVGIGVSDVEAWTRGAGLEFEIAANGQRKILIVDEICTLLLKEFFPMDLPNNSKVDLFAKNLGSVDIKAAAFIRAEVA